MGLIRDSLISVINDLKGNRPCFHSEDDFKFALAWKIKEKYSDADIRLEKPMPKYKERSQRKYLDIFLEFPCDSKRRVGIEVKYITAELKASINGEGYDLASHLAYPVRCYDCLLDIKRLERFIELKELDYGYALWLTNDENFWQPPKDEKRKTTYDNFRIFEGRTIKKGEDLKWGSRTSKGTKNGRKKSIKLEHRDYTINWELYERISETAIMLTNGSKTINKPNNEFEYSLNEIT